jgi:hypothetical protein
MATRAMLVAQVKLAIQAPVARRVQTERLETRDLWVEMVRKAPKVQTVRLVHLDNLVRKEIPASQAIPVTR